MISDWAVASGEPCLGADFALTVCWAVLSHVWFFATPWTVAHQAPLSWSSPSKNTGAGCHFLLQRIFLTHFWLNLHLPCLLHFRWILYPLSYCGSSHCSYIKPAMAGLLGGVLPLHQAECHCCFQFPNQLWKFHIYYSNSIEENCRAYRREICFCLLRILFFFLVTVPWFFLGHTLSIYMDLLDYISSPSLPRDRHVIQAKQTGLRFACKSECREKG